MNASLVRRVIFSTLFYSQNYFYSTLFRTSILQLIVAHLIFPSTSIIQMVNNGSRNSSNSDNNDVENLSSTLEHLLIVQAQLLQTVQQVMVQMQEVNQLMQSMEVRASSRKRKSNTQDDVDQAQKMSAVEKAATQNPNGKKCYNYGQKGHFALQCRNSHTRPPRTLSSTLAPITQPASQRKGGSASGRLRTGIVGYHVEDWLPEETSHD
jgi:hypothetical protein